MRLLKKIAVVAGVLVAIAACGVGVLLYRLGSVADGMCGNDILSQDPSPNGRLQLVVFERNCGATTGFSTHVSLLKTPEQLENEGGNVFVGDTNHRVAPAGLGGGPEVRVRWISDETAELRHHAQTRVFRAERSMKGVKITYVVGDDR